MKTIKIKVKYILLILLLLSVITLNKEAVMISCASFYNRLAPTDYEIDITAFTTNTLEGESRRLQVLLSEQPYSLFDLVTISNGATSMSSHIQTDSGNQIYEAYLSFAQQEDIYKDYPDYYLDVVLTQWFSGHVDRTLEMMAAVNPENLNASTYEHYQIIQLGIDLTYGHMDSAQLLLESLDSDGFARTANNIRFYMAEFFAMDVVYLDESNLPYTDFDNRFYGYLSLFEDIVDRYSFRNDDSNNDNTNRRPFSGQITLNGEYFTSLFLYEDHYPRGMSSLEGFESTVYRPDSHGRYEIPEMSSLTKSIGVMIPWQLIHDKQYTHINHFSDLQDFETFDFAMYDGAHFSELYIEDNKLYYKISDQSPDTTKSYYLKINFVDPSFNQNYFSPLTLIPNDEKEGSLDLSTLKNELKAPYVFTSGNVTYERLIEPLYLSGEYYFSLGIQNDNETPYYTSNGLFSNALSTKLYVAASEPSQGDLFLQDGAIDDAMRWFEANPSIHGAKVLSALYTRGYVEVEDIDLQPWELGGIDLDKAIFYSEQLINYGLKDRLTLSSLSNLYKEKKDYENEQRILYELESLFPSKYVSYDLARNSINRGDFMKGVESYVNAAPPKIDDDRYMHYLLVANLVDFLPESYLDLLSSIDRTDYEPIFEQIILGDYDKAWTLLSQMPDNDLKDFYQLLMLESFDTELINYRIVASSNENTDKTDYNDTRISYYVYVTDLLKLEETRKLLKMLKADSGWF